MASAVRSGKWLKIACAIALVIAIILLLFHFDEPLRRRLGGVKPGVRLMGEEMTGLFRAEVAAIVAELARSQGRKPVDAILDEAAGALIPELNGIEIDCEATIEQIMNATPGATVAPVYRQILPSIRWEHYPARPVYQGNPRKPAIALMINVAWGEEHLLPMLEVLEENGARGTFFLTGSWVEKNADLTRRIMEGGHELGNHGYSDSEVLPELDSWEIASSIRRTNEVIFEAAGCYPVYFTPHKGEFNDLTLELVSRQGMRTVLWTLDTIDWQKPGVAAMREKVLSGIGPGQIVLMHPTEDTVTLLEEIIPAIQERGLALVTMAELFDPAWLGQTATGAEE